MKWCSWTLQKYIKNKYLNRIVEDGKDNGNTYSLEVLPTFIWGVSSYDEVQAIANGNIH